MSRDGRQGPARGETVALAREIMINHSASRMTHQGGPSDELRFCDKCSDGSSKHPYPCDAVRLAKLILKEH
jgi:hypothetical protein